MILAATEGAQRLLINSTVSACNGRLHFGPTPSLVDDNETIQNSDDVFQVEGKLGEIKENEIRPRASANGTDSEQQLAISSQVGSKGSRYSCGTHLCGHRL